MGVGILAFIIVSIHNLINNWLCLVFYSWTLALLKNYKMSYIFYNQRVSNGIYTLTMVSF